jgi:hypothetical protein
MSEMQVIVTDSVFTAPAGQQPSSWIWGIPGNWEYLSLTVLPISSNANVEIISQGCSQTPQAIVPMV